MRRRHLEMLLTQVEGFEKPEAQTEQYATPAAVAAWMLHFAFMRGDLTDTVYDLGCGTGMLAVGAKLLGAEKVIGFDSDIRALRIARHNARKFDIEIEFVCCDISDVTGCAHTALMNPPFGAQSRGMDRPFLSKALELCDVVYTIHNAGSRGFIEQFIRPSVITDFSVLDFPIRRTFKFHKKDVEVIHVEMYKIESKKRDCY